MEMANVGSWVEMDGDDREPAAGGARVSHGRRRSGAPLVLTVNFGAPNIFVALWFELDYATNPPLGTLMI
jgi:hypothetical protein